MSSGSSGSSTTVPVPSRSIFDFMRRIVAVLYVLQGGYIVGVVNIVVILEQAAIWRGSTFRGAAALCGGDVGESFWG